MMNPVTCFSTVDQGRTFIAQDNQCVGSINSYNNWLTKFVTKLFGYSMDVQIGGKVRCLNKNSYSRFLNSQGVGFNNINEMRSFDHLTNLQKQGLMRDKLTPAKVDKLSRKLMQAAMNQDINKARDLVGKGADVNREFWIRGGRIVQSFHPGLALRNMTYTSTQSTPYLTACCLQDKTLAQFMASVGADLYSTGEALKFERSISKKETSSNWHPSMNSVTTVGRHGHLKTHLNAGMQQTTAKTTHYTDTVTRVMTVWATQDHYVRENRTSQILESKPHTHTEIRNGWNISTRLF